MLKTIKKALEVKSGNIVSAVGAGGKTTFLQTLARELAGQAKPVIVTTTTRIFPPVGLEPLLLIDQQSCRDAIEKALLKAKKGPGVIYLGREINSEGKVVGLSPEQVDMLKTLSSYTLVEADGAAGKSFKAPARHEPVIPEKTDLLCCVVGLEVLGKPLTNQYVHRSQRVSLITGLQEGERITPEAIAMVLTSQKGYYRSEYRCVPVLNQADNLEDIKNGFNIAEKIFSMSVIERVLITSFMNDPYMIITVKR